VGCRNGQVGPWYGRPPKGSSFRYDHSRIGPWRITGSWNPARYRSCHRTLRTSGIQSLLLPPLWLCAAEGGFPLILFLGGDLSQGSWPDIPIDKRKTYEHTICQKSSVSFASFWSDSSSSANSSGVAFPTARKSVLAARSHREEITVPQAIAKPLHGYSSSILFRMANESQAIIQVRLLLSGAAATLQSPPSGPSLRAGRSPKTPSSCRHQLAKASPDVGRVSYRTAYETRVNETSSIAPLKIYVLLTKRHKRTSSPCAKIDLRWN